ncbi:MAG TPA: hypothetical protein VH253_00720 [Phycisphaerae bacterium]|nr:hypothetical protein [Phycisphaerae bacterium]
MAFFHSMRRPRAAAMLAACVSLCAGAVLGYSAGTPATRGAASTRSGETAAAALARGKALYEQGRFVEARAAADRAIALDPANDEARLLRQAIEQHLAEAPATAAATAPSGITLLTPAQVSAVRLAELHEGDTHLRGTIDHATLVQFWNDVVKNEPGADTSERAEGAFLNPENFSQQVAAIRASGLQKYIDKIQLRSDPGDMVLFRTRVHPYVLENCATAACHASPTAKFRLLRPAGTSVSDQVLYTNFYILSTYTTGANGQEKMIDRDDPRKSLLLQYGLPKSIAATPHPGKIQVHRFPNEDSPDFQMMARWIRSLTFPTPVYQLPPAKGGAAATERGK